MSVDPGNRKLLRLEVRNAQTPIERKPSWIKTRAKMGPEYTALKSLVTTQGLATVCEHCQVRIVGHGVEVEGRFYCCAHCARHAEGAQGAKIKDAVGVHPG